jgi:hypothetical protein
MFRHLVVFDLGSCLFDISKLPTPKGICSGAIRCVNQHIPDHVDDRIGYGITLVKVSQCFIVGLAHGIEGFFTVVETIDTTPNNVLLLSLGFSFFTIITYTGLLKNQPTNHFAEYTAEGPDVDVLIHREVCFGGSLVRSGAFRSTWKHILDK